MRILIGKTICVGIVGFFIILGVYRIVSINRSVQNALADERSRLIDKNRVPYEKKILTSYLSENVEIIQNIREVRALIDFQDSYFAATSGGLVQISYDGKILRRFTVLDGLPESDLTCLAVFGNKLYIGTQTKGLVVFDGEKFEGYTWIDRKSQAVTAFLVDDGRLLIGTFNDGLMEFDGSEFSELKAEKERILTVNSLFKDKDKLYVGTFNNGVWIYENDIWSHFTTADGLPSNRVVGIAVKDNIPFIATDFGLSVLEGRTLRELAVIPTLTGIALANDRLLLVKDDGGFFAYDKELKDLSVKRGLRDSRFAFTDGRLWLLSDNGVFEIYGLRPRLFAAMTDDPLSDNFVSAMAFDRNENLWVGAFRRGIDVFSPQGSNLKHIETDDIREINYIEAADSGVAAATSGGLARFRKDFSFDFLTKKTGLPSNSVTHLTKEFIATTKGLAFMERGKIRVLSTVQGLPSDSTYTTLLVDKKLYVGTLSGLAEIEGSRVTRTFKDSNSNLTTNWVTGLCLGGDRLFIGTYGGGVFELLPSGDIRSFEPETGKFTVNPNAMYSDGEQLYIGTLSGVKILDLRSQEWKTVKNILPSETVMSIAANADSIYFGTTSGIARVDRRYFQNK